MAKDVASTSIGVYGLSAIGSLLTALLCRAHADVYCFGSEAAVETALTSGIRVNSDLYGVINCRPNVSSTPSIKVDLLFIAVKSPALKGALKAIRGCINEDTIIISLLNGVGHREIIRDACGHQVAVGTIGAVEAVLNPDRVVLHTSPMIPHIEIASDADIKPERLSIVASLIKSIGMSVAIGENENQVIWSKLVRLGAIATMTALTNLPIGVIRVDRKLRILLEALVEEYCQVALAEGGNFLASDVLRQIDNLPGSITTSLQRDINSGRESELDSILGEVINIGQKFGINLPAMGECYSTLKSKAKRI